MQYRARVFEPNQLIILYCFEIDFIKKTKKLTNDIAHNCLNKNRYHSPEKTKSKKLVS